MSWDPALVLNDQNDRCQEINNQTPTHTALQCIFIQMAMAGVKQKDKNTMLECHS